MKGDRRPAGSRVDRLYRTLLRAFPFDFRTDHGREMEQTFRAQRHSADQEGRMAVTRLWADTVLDLFTTAPRQHLAILRQDTAYAVRSLRRAPVFAASVVLTLALGMSATAGMFTIVNAVMLRPLPVDRPEQLVSISHASGAPFGLSFRDLVDLREERSVLTDLMGYAPRPSTLNAGRESERIVLAAVTDNYFSMLGVQPAAGRLIRPDEGRAPGDAPVIVLAHDYWMARFNGEPSVVGRVVRLSGRPYTIIGVASGRFSDTDALVRIDAYVPAWRLDDFGEVARTSSVLNDRRFRQFTVLGRLKPGVSLEQTRSALEIRNAAIPRDWAPITDDLSLRVVPETHARPNPELGPRLRMAATAMMGLSLVLLLITSASVTNLLMARAGSRRRELAVRAALGARLGRVVRQLLTEAVVLALMAAVAAVPIVVALTNALRELIANASAVTRLDPDFSVDLRVLAVTFAIAVCAGLVAGVAPAAAACRADLTGSLKNGIGATRGTPPQRWGLAASSGGVRTALVVVQVALALALLVSGGLFMRSLDRARDVDLGFDPNDLILASTAPGIAGLDRPQRLAFYHAVRDRVAMLPGVETAAWISFPPLGIIGDVATVSPDERRQDVDWQPPTVSLADVSGEYFATARVPVIEGRPFDDRDTATATPVVIVNDTLARQFWPNRSPVGRRLAVRGATLEVVGVVRTGKYQTVWESPRGAVFRPLAQAAPALATLTVKASRGAPELGFGVERIVRDVNPDVAIYDVRSMIEHLDTGSAFFPFRVGAMISSIFGGLGLLLASIALYGMVAYDVGQQTREFGIRMALGARRSDIIGGVLARGGRFALLGVGVGVALASALAHALRTLLVGVSPFDPATHASVAGLLVGICVLSSFLPAWRAAIRDPLVALRSE